MLRSKRVLQFGVTLAHYVTLSSLSIFVDTLRLSADDTGRPLRCQWHIMSASGRPARSSCGVVVHPTAGLIASQKLNYIAVVGGLHRRQM
jgi:transcriptional regulator GlxA family with amidase domain